MTEVRRVIGAGAIVSLAAFITCSQVWGDPKREKDKDPRDLRPDAVRPADRLDRGFAENAAVNRFTDQPLVLSATQEGDTLAALQVKPDLEPAPARPRDILVVLDPSASKAKGPLALAIKIVETLAAKLER